LQSQHEKGPEVEANDGGQLAATMAAPQFLLDTRRSPESGSCRSLHVSASSSSLADHGSFVIYPDLDAAALVCSSRRAEKASRWRGRAAGRQATWWLAQDLSTAPVASKVN
jgi:hypothetical protein